jgi:hypothetical protein
MVNLRRGFRVATNSRPGEALPGTLSRKQHRSTDSRSSGAAQARRSARPQAPGARAQRFFGEEGGRHAIQQARSG